MRKKYLGFLTVVCLAFGIGGGVANVSYAASKPCFADNSYTITASSGKGDNAEEIEFTVVFDSDGNISEDSDFSGFEEDSTLSRNPLNCGDPIGKSKINKKSFTAGYGCLEEYTGGYDDDDNPIGNPIIDTTIKLKFGKGCEKVTGTLTGTYYDENEKKKKITYKLTGEVD